MRISPQNAICFVTSTIRGRQLQRRARDLRINRNGSRRFLCPICRYEGDFLPVGEREHALCPQCYSMERHRLQWVVVQKLGAEHDFSTMSLLHIAPEPSLARELKKKFGGYTSAVLGGQGADLDIDLRRAALPTASFDVVYASHVLEHIDDDVAAIAEIRRILRPAGFAVLPVPILCHWTVEYGKAVPEEAFHVRAPGPDYFDRFKDFAKVEVWTSSDFDERYQTWAIEDRTLRTDRVPTEARLSYGTRHADMVPICFV
jgi:SAM-dependent methyltransferase